MQVLDFITLLIILAAIFTLVNVKYLKLPSTIGLMILALGLSLFIVFGEALFSALKHLSTDMMTRFKFSEVLFQVMLSFLLFAGALDMNVKKMGEEKWPILILATLGTLISTFLVGTGIFYALPIVDIHVDYIYCLLFGALISPTDPIAVLAMIKKTPVSKNLESQIAGESLFNDGVGVVVFITILSLAEQGGAGHLEPGHIAIEFGKEVLGGLALGAIIGIIGLYLLKVIDNTHTEIEVLVTLSMVLGGASVAKYIGVSGPLAMVVMGLWVGREGREKDADAAGEYVYKFWHLMDEAMNAILFILIGLQIIRIADELASQSMVFLFAIPVAIVIVLISRLVGVGLPVSIMRIKRHFPSYTVRILTWSGLRGGISVALALSLYEPTEKGFLVPNNDVNIITAMTYGVVLFSIVVQGLTVNKLFEKYDETNADKAVVVEKTKP